MTDYTKKVRSYLISVDDELQKVLSSVDEEDLFLDSLKEELRHLEEAEAASLGKAGEEIISALESSRDEKLVGAKRDLDSSARELARRWEAAEKMKKSLQSQNRVTDAQLEVLKEELARLRNAKKKEKDDFSQNMNSLLDKVRAAADDEEKISRKESARKVAGSILAYKKRPESQTPMRDLLPIDRSVSRIYQQMSYLIEGEN